MARQFIYHMAGLNKSYGAKKVLENIHLSFYPDAKIGILGPNGAGKSTVLRIMAGLDKEFTGEAWLAEGATLRIPAAGTAARREPRTCSATSWKAWPKSRRSSTATTS
jgi:ATPase subunit of ABC transporter with duplicated ATPase domains